MNLKWYLLFLPWPIKLFIYFSTIVLSVKLFSGTNPLIFTAGVVSICVFVLHVLGPHASSIRKDHPDLLRLQSKRGKSWI
jgi:hypothetical protein